jgi:hypothetical protein
MTQFATRNSLADAIVQPRNMSRADFEPVRHDR